MILLLTDVFLLLTQVLLWLVVGLVAWFVLLKALPRAFLSLLVLLLILVVLALSFVTGPPRDGGVLEILWRIISFPFTPLGLAIVLLAILLSGTKLTTFARRAILIGLIILALGSFPFVAYYLAQELEMEAIELITAAPNLEAGGRRVIVLLGQGTTRSYLRPPVTNALAPPQNAPPLSPEAAQMLARLPLQKVEGDPVLVPTAFLQTTTSEVNLDEQFQEEILLAQAPPGPGRVPRRSRPPAAPAGPGGATPEGRVEELEQRAQELERAAEQMKRRAEEGESRLDDLTQRAEEGQNRIDEMKKRAAEIEARAAELRRRAEESRTRAAEAQERASPPADGAAPGQRATPASPASPAASPRPKPKIVITKEAYPILTGQPIQLTERGNRLIYAAQLFQQETGNNPLIVVSASTRPDRRQKEGERREDISESADIQRFLTNTMRVPASGILLEHNSRSVRQSAENVKKLLADQNINYGGQITLVTSALNMNRAALTFAKVFDEATIVVRPTDFHTLPPPESIGEELATGTDVVERQFQASDFLPSADALYLSTQAIDEYISAFYYFLRGWIKPIVPL